MITALDSSVILDVIMRDPVHFSSSLAAVRRAHREGKLVISEFVVAEIQPIIPEPFEKFLAEWELEFVPCSKDAAVQAGSMFSSWLKSGGKRGRIVADFLIAAHARHHADRLLTRDSGFLRKHFKGIRVTRPDELS